ncbi:hypothetical protein LINGRAHAP2_LOCUS36060 [Linum grandiflorum]
MEFPADAPTQILFKKEVGTVIFDEKITESVDKSSAISAQPVESVCKQSDRETVKGLSQVLESVKISSSEEMEMEMEMEPEMEMGYYDDGELVEDDDGMVWDEDGWRTGFGDVVF